jgi:LuxR family maltose regulon positive regulatory protein
MDFSFKELIVYSKIEKPSIQNNLIPRKNLKNILDKYINKKLVFISSPSGFGKTTLIIKWSEINNKNIAWFSVCKKDNNLISFIKYLVISIQKNINSNFGKDVLIELDKEDKDFDKVINLFINNFFIYPSYYLVFIDNYQEISNINILETINFIINNIPKNVTFFILSRSKDVLLDLDKFRVKNELLELSEKELKLTFDETENLFKLNNINLDRNDLEKIYYKSEGWILSLNILIIHLKKDKSLDVLNNLDNRLLFDYIFNDILKNIDKKVLDFLVKTSLLPSFSYELSNKILNINNSFEIIDNLDRKNLFLISLDDKGFLFRYHNIFNQLLRRKFSQLFDKYLENEIRNTALSWYIDNDMFFDALQQLLILDKQNDILEMLNKILINEKYNIDKLTLNYLEKIPLDEIIKFERVFFYYLHNLIEKLDPLELDKLYELILNNNKLLNNEKLSIYLLFLKYNKFYLEKDYKQAEIYINECLELSKKDNNNFMINVSSISLAYIYSKNLDNKKSITSINNLIPFFKNNESVELKIMSNNLFSLLLSNQIKEAEDKCNYIIKNLDKIKYSYNYEYVRVNTLVAKLSLNFYKNKKNDDIIKILLDHIPNTINNSIFILIYNNISNLLISYERIDEAEMLITQMENNHPFLKNDAIFLRLRVLLYKDKNKASDLYNSLNFNIDNIEFNFIFTILNLYVSTNEFDLANKLIENFYKKHNQEDSLYSILILIFRSLISYKIDPIKNKYTYISLMEKAILVIEKTNIIGIFLTFSTDLKEIIKKIILDINKVNKNLINNRIDLKYLESILVLFYKNFNSTDNKILLTKREIELLEIFSENLSNIEISERLNISINTLKTHIKKIYSKLGVNNRDSAFIKYQSLLD